MIKLKIFPDPSLKIPAKPVKRFNNDLKRKAAEMIRVMIKIDNAIGLASRQVNIEEDIIVILNPDDKKQYILCNAKIVKEEGSQIGSEQCLSLPGITIEKERPEQVKVEYQDLYGTKKEMKCKGLSARLLCHEIEHNKGVLMTDGL
jgi:peptide deformylase